MARVLVVDDDATIQRLLAVNLEMEGHEVVAAGDGAEAMAALADDPLPDVLLVDVMMPELDGYEVCERVRADERLASLPLVFLSARAQQADIARGREAGADAYVTKPFDPTSLVELVDALAAGGRAAAPPMA